MGVSLEGIDKELDAKRQKDTQFKLGHPSVKTPKADVRQSGRSLVSLPEGTPIDLNHDLGQSDSQRYPQRGVSYDIAKRVG